MCATFLSASEPSPLGTLCSEHTSLGPSVLSPQRASRLPAKVGTGFPRTASPRAGEPHWGPDSTWGSVSVG